MALSDERIEKLCRKCETVKPLAEFSKAAKYKDGLQTQCKSCAAAHYESRKELIRERQRANCAIEAEARRDALEEAAQLVEKATYRTRWVKAAVNGQASNTPPCALAAAIRKLKEDTSEQT